MRIDVLSQSLVGGRTPAYIGDMLNTAIADTHYQSFRFAVAYMRVSGLRLLYGSLQTLLNRNGRIAGAVGIDEGITTIEALNLLLTLSSNSTIVHTVSNYIYHPKLYLLSGSERAVAVIGSSNFTRDGLYRNLELANAIYLELKDSSESHTTARRRPSPTNLETLFPRLPVPQPPAMREAARMLVTDNTPAGALRKSVSHHHDSQSILSSDGAALTSSLPVHSIDEPASISATPHSLASSESTEEPGKPHTSIDREDRKPRKERAKTLAREQGLSLNYAYLVIDGSWTIEKALERSKNKYGLHQALGFRPLEQSEAVFERRKRFGGIKKPSTKTI